MKIIAEVSEIDTQLDKLAELIELMDRAENKAKELVFLNVKDVAKMTGWSLPIVRQLFNRPDFPSCDFGKEKIVEISAAREYFRSKRKRD